MDTNHNSQVSALLDQLDFPQAHRLIDVEIVHLSRSDIWGCTRTIHTLCWALSLENRPENIWKIWQAKNCNQDTYFSIDVVWIYLCFPTIDSLIQYVISSTHPDKNDLLERIERDRSSWLTIEKFASLSRSHFKVTKEYIQWG